MASSPPNGMNTPGATDSHTPGPGNVAGDNAAPTFAEIRVNGATFTCGRHPPSVIRRYISERQRPLGYKRPLSASVARERMRAKLSEFDARFNSARAYDQFCEPASHSTVYYPHEDVLDIVAPWLYPYGEDDGLSRMVANIRL
ncbi:hypothetical protein A9Z42_0088690 [Trichoderma parareesei]|uniref:Uncharacterized protein n=1 Tax=Trichoderma parareesei TaxID=858221 RepID=A0A2H2ZY18_TRIPA|nr:hypothetical protein A9Z42_0088690 [Trichoderma parareesei]